MLTFTLRGQKYNYDEERLTLGELSYIKKKTGMTLAPFLLGCKTADPDALQGLLYLAKKRAGEKVDWDALAEIDILNDFEFEDDEDDETAATEEAEEGNPPAPPTSTSTRKSSGRSGSRRSAST